MGDMLNTIRISRPVWEAKNFAARFRYWKRGVTPTAAEATVIRELRANGIATIPMEQLCDRERLLELMRFVERREAVPDIAALLRGEGRVAVDTKKKSAFLVSLWEGEHILDAGHPFLRFSLSEPVVNVVSGYLGMFPKFREFFLEVTVPVPAGTEPFASQRWHADPEDRRMVKVFLYLNDVDADAGPFTYIRGTHGWGRYRHFFPSNLQEGRRPDPALIERVIPSEDIVRATGTAGTVIFCDTSGIHRGGYATEHRRIMYTSVFTTPGGSLPKKFQYPKGFDPEAFPGGAARYAVR